MPPVRGASTVCSSAEGSCGCQFASVSASSAAQSAYVMKCGATRFCNDISVLLSTPKRATPLSCYIHKADDKAQMWSSKRSKCRPATWNHQRHQGKSHATQALQLVRAASVAVYHLSISDLGQSMPALQSCLQAVDPSLFAHLFLVVSPIPNLPQSQLPHSLHVSNFPPQNAQLQRWNPPLQQHIFWFRV